MHICRFTSSEGPRTGLEVGGDIYDIGVWCALQDRQAPRDTLELLLDERWAEFAAVAPPEQARVTEADLLPPMSRPGKVLALAANYADHAAEVGERVRDKTHSVPHVFPKLPSTLVGPYAPIRIPQVSDMVDYEVEMALLIGRITSDVSPLQARGCVAGYLVVNDISARRMTFAERPDMPTEDATWDFLYGKWCNGFAVAGPWAVPAREIPNPETLKMTLTVNGQMRQSAVVGDWIFSAWEAISFISRICILEPGDVIAMGTPAGIGEMGLGCLEVGDVVSASIEGLGTQRNAVTALAAGGST